MNELISIPVTATIKKQPDGSFKMTSAEFMEVDPAAFVEFLAGAFGLREVKQP